MAERLRIYGPALLSAILIALAFAPTNLYLLVLIGPAPWLFSLRELKPKQARWSGFWFGLIFMGHQLWWLAPFLSKWLQSWAIGGGLWILATLIASLYFILLGGLINSCWRSGFWWLIPLVWAGVEALRGYIPGLAFPWGNLAHPLWLHPAFVQHASFGTVYLVSAWVVLGNFMIGLWLWPDPDEKKRPSGQAHFRLTIVFLGFLFASAWRFSQPIVGEKKAVAAAQIGVDMAFSDRAQRDMMIARSAVSLRNQALQARPWVLVMPESVTETDERVPPISPFGSQPGLNMIFGGLRHKGDDTYQTAFFHDGEWEAADKTRLVIFGEYVPMRGLIPEEAFNLPSGDLRPGLELLTPDFDGVPTGAFVCFEGLFPDIAARHSQAGARLYAQMSIDDWYIDTYAWDQLWQSSIWRCIEGQTPMVRAASLGKTMVIDARGRVVGQAPKKKEVLLREEIVIPEKSESFAYRFWFVYAAWGACLFTLGHGLWRRWRREGDSNPRTPKG